MSRRVFDGIESKESQSEIKLLSLCFDYVKNLQDKDKYSEYNLSLYMRIMETLVPRFTPYIVTEIKTHEEHPISISSRYPLDTKEAYEIELKETSPRAQPVGKIFLGLSSKKMTMEMMKTTIFFPLLASKYAPVSFDEALFIMGHEIAHKVLAHSEKMTYEQKLSSRLKYDYRWYLNRMLNIDYESLWEKERANNELEADSLSVKVGGLQALQGGITYTARRIIKDERGYNAWCMNLSFLLSSGDLNIPLPEDRLISLLRIWKIFSLTSDYATEYYKIIDDMPDWQESQHQNDYRIKKKLHNFVQKAEDSSFKLPSNYGFFLKTVVPATTTAVGVSAAIIKCMCFN